MTEQLSSFGNWELKKSLGEGGFGEVLLWQHNSKQQLIATKRLKKNDCLCTDEIYKLKERWQQEYEWMKNLNTDYIVRGIDVADAEFVNYLNEHHYWRPLPVIIMEYCNSGDLRSHLEKVENINGLHEFEVREVLRALRYAVEYLHTQCKIEHRDLKPDNIVIHQEGNKRIYKLTDFGFARKTSESTIVKSVVGTRHYFAPEIVDTAKYTNTVDYWSVGVIAFELICGVTPFIPHQELYNIITQIKKKQRNCIAIIEDPDNANKFIHKEKIFEENRMSSEFLHKIERWLPLALDADYKKRGLSNDETNKIHGDVKNHKIQFYTELDAILDTKILTVFCLNTYQLHSYEIATDQYDTLLFKSNFIDKLTEWTGHAREQLFLVLPLLHPIEILKPDTKLIDLFVENWQDTSNDFNPPVMLYVLGYQCEYQFGDPYISDVIKYCIHRTDIDERTGKWLIPKLELHTHFLLSREQRKLETFIAGLQQYLLTIENNIFNFESTLQTILNEILIACGTVRQFYKMIFTAKKIYESQISGISGFFLSWLSKAENFKNELENLNANVGLTLKKRYNSALRRAKQETENKIYVDYIKKDHFSVETFRKYIKSSRYNATLNGRLNICTEFVYSFLANRRNCLQNTTLKKSEDLITELNVENRKIQEIVKNSEKFLIQFDLKMTNETENFQMELLNIQKNNQANELQSVQNFESIQMNSILNDLCSLNKDQIIEEAMNKIQLIKMELDEK